VSLFPQENLGPEFLEKIGAGTPPFPDPQTVPIVRNKYQTVDGAFPRVTQILKILGLGTEGLIKWAATEERKACIAAATEVWLDGVDGGPQEFAEAVLRKVGAELANLKLKNKAADLGTAVHAKVHWWHQCQLGAFLEEPAIPEAGELSFMAYQDWWNQSGLTAVRVEQPVWDRDLGYAGTIDNVAVDSAGNLGIVDLKTSRYLYDHYHLQCVGYLRAGRRWAPLQWAKLVRLPKSLDDPQIQKREPVEVRELGKLYDRTLSEAELMTAFEATVGLYHTLLGKD
jgi:hypothetical protein